MKSPEKTCTRCKVTKPLKDFYKAKTSKDGHTSACKSCTENSRRESAERNKDRVNSTQRAYRATRKDWVKSNNLKSHYGIDLSEYTALLIQQQGRCAICGADSKLHVDHDHETSAVRGLLCRNCNVGIGMLKDDRVLLLRAAKYLE